MKFAEFYFEADEPIAIADVARALAPHGYRAVFQAAREAVDSEFDATGLPKSPLLFGPDDAELLVNDRGPLLGRVVSRGPRRGTRRAVEFLVPAERPDSTVAAVVGEALDVEIIPGSLSQAAQAKRLSAQAGKESPNGRILADLETRDRIRDLYDDELRDAIRPVASAFADAPTSRDVLARLGAFPKGGELLRRLLSDGRVFVPRFAVHCSECESSHLAFNDASRAGAVIEDASHRCLSCGKRALVVLETFALSDVYAKGILQGLWLESFASDVMSERTTELWTGQMFGANEIDVLGLFAHN